MIQDLEEQKGSYCIKGAIKTGVPTGTVNRRLVIFIPFALLERIQYTKIRKIILPKSILRIFDTKPKIKYRFQFIEDKINSCAMIMSCFITRGSVSEETFRVFTTFVKSIIPYIQFGPLTTIICHRLLALLMRKFTD
jgi:hypothetical protein